MLLRCQVRRKQENALAALRALEVPILHPLASLFRCLPSFQLCLRCFVKKFEVSGSGDLFAIVCVCVFPSVGLNHEPTCCQWSMQQNLMECLQWFNDRNLIDLVVKEMRCWRSVLARSVSMEQTHRKAANRLFTRFRHSC